MSRKGTPSLYRYYCIGRDPSKFQHQGFGTLLMEEAERIAREEHGAGVAPCDSML